MFLPEFTGQDFAARVLNSVGMQHYLGERSGDEEGQGNVTCKRDLIDVHT